MCKWGLSHLFLLTSSSECQDSSINRFSASISCLKRWATIFVFIIGTCDYYMQLLHVCSYLTGKFIQHSKIHGRNTRCSGELDLPICRLKTGQRSFAFQGAKLYNNLPNEMKQISDVKKFKTKVSNYLLNV